MGLALATAGAAYLNAGLLFRGLVVRDIYGVDAPLRADLLKIVLATLAMSVLLLACMPWLHDLAALGWAGRSWRLAAVCVAGMAVYAGGLLLLRPAFLMRGLRRLREPVAK
jgi:putative peptidoglycan lipid II flippase